MRVQSSNFAQLANRVYQQLPTLSLSLAPAAPPIARRQAACLVYLRSLSDDERLKGVSAIIASAETPMLVRLLGRLADVRKGVALTAPLEGLVITPSGFETLLDGRPQNLQPMPLFDLFDDLDAFRAAIDHQLTALYEGYQRLPTRYFAPKNILAALLMQTPDEM